MLPPALYGEGCPFAAYVSPRQILRILKRREVKRRLLLTGRLPLQRNVSKLVSMVSMYLFRLMKNLKMRRYVQQNEATTICLRVRDWSEASVEASLSI